MRDQKREREARQERPMRKHCHETRSRNVLNLGVCEKHGREGWLRSNCMRQTNKRASLGQREAPRTSTAEAKRQRRSCGEHPQNNGGTEVTALTNWKAQASEAFSGTVPTSPNSADFRPIGCEGKESADGNGGLAANAPQKQRGHGIRRPKLQKRCLAQLQQATSPLVLSDRVRMQRSW